MTVSFITMCHPPHLERLHFPGVLEGLVASHAYQFDEVIIVHQRCKGLEYTPAPVGMRVVESESYPDILSTFGMFTNDPVANRYTHGPTAAHFWKWHMINHLIGAIEASGDYIVFSDCDCKMVDNPPDHPWVEKGIELLNKQPLVLVVSPNDGGMQRATRRMSQQCFMIRRQDFLSIDFTLPFTGFEPGGPFQEYYFMLEGRIARYMKATKKCRFVLPDTWRYWHSNPWEVYPKGQIP